MGLGGSVLQFGSVKPDAARAGQSGCASSRSRKQGATVFPEPPPPGASTPGQLCSLQLNPVLGRPQEHQALYSVGSTPLRSGCWSLTVLCAWGSQGQKPRDLPGSPPHHGGETKPRVSGPTLVRIPSRLPRPPLPVGIHGRGRESRVPARVSPSHATGGPPPSPTLHGEPRGRRDGLCQTPLAHH